MPESAAWSVRAAKSYPDPLQPQFKRGPWTADYGGLLASKDKISKCVHIIRNFVF